MVPAIFLIKYRSKKGRTSGEVKREHRATHNREKHIFKLLSNKNPSPIDCLGSGIQWCESFAALYSDLVRNDSE